ncbi:MAG: DUF2252 domain-containing protein, partial [Acidimicrobiia bacterium]|nr:DUF2252 domain-containing protein [Acidimicrobiia bacterium]
MVESATPADRRALGEAIRKTVPRTSHAAWSPPGDRADPVALLTEQDTDRLQWLVPIRHSRMAESAFTFYRGAAKIMATDLAGTPSTGLSAQICGDAHLSNFGSFASPEREQIFDINDFDETLPGPWEWDLKRLATSFVLAGRDNNVGDNDIREMTASAVVGYQQAMARFTTMTTLDAWYAHLTLQQITDAMPKKKDRAAVEKSAAKSRSKGSLRALGKLAEKVDGTFRIKSQPPLLVPLRDLPSEGNPDELGRVAERSFAQYKGTLDDNRRVLIDKYRIVDIAVKVVGVGSVGTRCFIALLEGNDDTDPLFLQVKEATASVLETGLPRSAYSHHGQRVVEGQRLMQAASDIFLGWSAGDQGRTFYWRQLYDMKGSVDVSKMSARRLKVYATLCGWTLAHAHARSGDPFAISGYLG